MLSASHSGCLAVVFGSCLVVARCDMVLPPPRCVVDLSLMNAFPPQTYVRSPLFSLVPGVLLVALLSVSCSNEIPKPPLDRLHFPISSALHPSGNYLYVVNSNFDTRFDQPAGGVISVLDTKNGGVLASGSMRIPSFGGILKVNQTATKVYIPTRFGSSVTVLDLSPDGSTVRCVNDSGESVSDAQPCQVSQLADNDGKKGPKLGSSPYDIDVQTIMRSTTVSGIAATDTVTVVFPSGRTLKASGSLAQIATSLSADPVLKATVQGTNLVLETSDRTGIAVIPSPSQTVQVDADDLVYATSLDTDVISTLYLPKQDRTQLSITGAAIGKGSGGIAKRPHSQDVLAVQRLGTDLVVFRPVVSTDASRIESMISVGALPLNVRSGKVVGKGIAFSEDGSHAYVVTQYPSALHVIRVLNNPSSGSDGVGGVVEVYQPEQVVPLKASPTSVVVHPSPSGDRLYITCTAAKRVLVVDPRPGAVIDEVLLGDTPSHMAINEAKCQESLASCVGYVTLYDDTPNVADTCSTSASGRCGSVAVIDLNPFSSRYHQLIRKYD